MKKNVFRVAVAALLVCAAGTARAATLQLPYASPAYMAGGSADNSASTLTSTAALAFPNLTLNDVKALLDDGYVIGGCKCGSYWNPRVAAQVRNVLVCRNATTHAITKIVGLFVLCDSHTKSVAVELTDGDGGVYARGGRSQLLSGKVVPDFVFAELNANGDGVIYRCDSSNKGGASAATLASYDGGGYGICGVTLAKVPNHTAPTLVWANASGENVLTVEDLKDYDLSARFCGSTVTRTVLGTTAREYNRFVETNELGVATSMTAEFQVLDGTTVRCVVVKFTNGTDGVCALTLGWDSAENGTLGQRFMAADGTFSSNAASSDWYGRIANNADGCGVYALAATPKGYPYSAYTSPNLLGSTHDVFDPTKLPMVAGSWVKVFDDVSLQDVVDGGYEISAWMCGASLRDKQRVVAKKFQTYTPEGETSVSNAICVFTIYDSGSPRFTKSATILLENREDGVYAKYGKGQYIQKDAVNLNFAWIDANGVVVYESTQTGHSSTGNSNVPASWNANGYGIAGLSASKYMKKNVSCRVWANPHGEPALTLDDIKDYYFGCRCSGRSMGTKGREGVGLNRAFTYDGNGSVTSMRVEFQTCDGGWVKCVSVMFTNGVDGVYGYAMNAHHSTTMTYTYPDFKFYNANGGTIGYVDAVATSATALSYGIYDLFAAPITTLDGDADWSGRGTPDVLGETAVVNLNGHSLTVDGVSGDNTTYAKFINTNAAVTAELHVKVPATMPCINANVYLGKSEFNTQNIKLFKEGPGDYTSSLAQEYKGGTEISGGTLKAGLDDANVFGATSQAVQVNEGGVLDWNSHKGLHVYPAYVLNGGVVQNTGTDLGYDNSLAKGMTLLANSYFSVSHSWGLLNGDSAEVALDLGGHVLDVDISSGKTAHFTNVRAAGAGNIYLHGDGVFEVRPGGNGFLATNVDLRAACELRLLGPMSVRDYVAADTKDGTQLGDGPLNVYGTFKPETLYFRGCTMQDGSTIDFSELTGVWPVTSAYTCEGITNITFAADAQVTIDAGDHPLEIGDCLIPFAVGYRPNPSTQFVLCTNGVPVEGKVLVAKENGLCVKDARIPAFARWDISAEAWKFFLAGGGEYSATMGEAWNGGVTGDMQVRFSTSAEYAALLTKDVSPSAFVLTDFTTVPGVTNDFTGTLPFIFEEGMTFDVKGGCLKLPTSMMGGDKAFTVTSSEEGGILNVNVPDGETVNTKMSLTGSLKVEKTGAGSFVAAKTEQTYTGGTEVIEGTFKAGVYNANIFGASTATVQVDEGAVLDWNGCHNYQRYPGFVLNGGTMQNSVADFGKDHALLKGITVLTNSYLKAITTWGLINGSYAEIALNLGGNTLDVDLCGKRIYVTNVRVPDSGNINVHGGGILEVRSDSSGCGFAASNVNLYADCELRAHGQVHVHDYVAAATSNAANLATGTLNVYGAFKPVTRYFRGCTMRDGSTLDFSEWPGEWPVTTAYTCSGNKAIGFADSATVKVKLGGRKVSTKTPIISWTTAPDATFVCGDENRQFAIKKKDDGLYLYTGTFIIVR